MNRITDVISFKFAPPRNSSGVIPAKAGIQSFVMNRIRPRVSKSGITTSGMTKVTGDIYIASKRSRLQAKDAGHGWDKELAYLVIHGILHLLGYTDYTPVARRRMFQKQDKIFKCLFS